MTLFSQHREGLRQKLPQHLIVLSAYNSVQSSGDMSAIFLQESNFWYLTGIEVADWVLIFDTGKNRSWLVSPEVDEVHRVFDGGLSGEEAKAISGVDEVIDKDAAQGLLRDLARSYETVHTLGTDPHESHYDFIVNPAIKNNQAFLEGIFKEVLDCRRDLAELRAIKQPGELARMREAIQLTTETFSTVKQLIPGLSHEYEIEAEFSYQFRKYKGATHAYDPIVASGAHACTLHCHSNLDSLPENGLVLIDIGARVEGYAADITRTYAVGIPTDRQRAVHAAVEKAHHEIIELLKPGLSIAAYHQSVDTIMHQALERLDLLKQPDDYRIYFPHAISHGLGIDVHDSLGGPKEFVPGMVLTVEPGIYIPEEGIGVRIEDNILITDDGHENLSARLTTGL